MSQSFRLPINSIANDITITDVINDFNLRHDKGIFLVLKNIDVHVQLEITTENVHVKYYTPTAKQGLIPLPKPFNFGNPFI
jgi:hypothetical protein